MPEWLVDLEGQGLSFFEDSLLKLSSKLTFAELKDSSEMSMPNLESKQTDGRLFSNNKREVAEEMQSADAAFLAAAQMKEIICKYWGGEKKQDLKR